MGMIFKKYNSIENSYREKFIELVIKEGFASYKYVVEEKIHGANFSIWINKDSIKYAKRSGFIGETENFFNYEVVADKYEQNIKELYKNYRFSENTEVVVYGELYGGHYPHKDVKSIDHKKVQGHIYYRPDNDIMIFDITVNGRYLNVPQVHTLCQMFGLPYAQTLYTGSLADCLNYKNEFQTTIPDLLGLPRIEENTCEGVVIRPLEPTYLSNGTRIIIKNKNDKYKEKQERPKKRSIKVKTIILSPHIQKEIDKASEYINNNRLRNVLSKIGRIDKKDFGKLLGLFVKDVLEDLVKDESITYESLSKSDKKIINKNINKLSTNLIRKSIVDIINGDF